MLHTPSGLIEDMIAHYTTSVKITYTCRLYKRVGRRDGNFDREAGRPVTAGEKEGSGGESLLSGKLLSAILSAEARRTGVGQEGGSHE